jgi:N6-L-threonylcarbamoyladenine synthase
LPRPLLGRAEPHFSFAGLKSAVRRLLDSGAVQSAQHKADVAASFQQAVIECMVDRTQRALAQLDVRPAALVVAGGVAANSAIRAALAQLAAKHELDFVAPPLWLCTDNAAMIAWAGAERFALGMLDDLSVPAKARWPLDPAADKARGAGVKA